MDDLVVWLRAQLDTDAARAEEAAAVRGGHWSPQSLQSGRRTARHYVGASFEAGVVRSDSEVMSGGAVVVRHTATHDPARVLREIDAKRATIADYEKALRMRDRLEPNTSGYRHWDNRALGLLHALRHAAAVYADQPGYDEMLAAEKAALLADE